MAISPETVEEVQRTANVYEVISDYVNLKRAGMNYIALCPFHNEKTPSFVVSPTKNIFKCFGCGVSGDAIKFIMEYERISFSEAIEKIANKYGIKIKYTGKDRQIQLKAVFEITSQIKDFYRDSLIYSEDVKEYLKSRGVSSNAIKHFEIGYSPKEAERFLEFCKERNLDIQKLVEIGVLSNYENGRLVNKFSGRVIFPIKDLKGNVVAFGGRALYQNMTPKYINSPESIVYQKGKILYGMFENLNYIKEKYQAIVVEGYIDLISLWQLGVRNIVATLGTAFTPHHSKMLSKFVQTVYLMFDNDDAGKKATIQAAKALLSEGIDVRYVIYDDSKDPDEFSKKGSKAVLDSIEHAQNIILYTSRKIKESKTLKDVQQRFKSYKKLYQILTELLSSIQDVDLKYSYLQIVSEELGLSLSELQKDVSNVNHNVSKEEIEEKNHLNRLTFPEKTLLKTAFERPYLLKDCDFCDKINISPLLKYYFNLILSEEYEEVKEQIKSIEYSVPEELFYQELFKIHQRVSDSIERDFTTYASLTEEEKLSLAYRKISNKSLNRRF
ncbi:MAG: DNA primase [Hydrogenothermaceae bacterium]|nr:DNA primase [Hydrogenothermaceae bacterium]